MPSRGWLAILFFAILAAFTVGLGSFPFTERSEARYAGVAWEMMDSGDYLTPRYNGIKHFHKPPLFYWLTAASMKVLGPGEGAARVPCALGALATIALTAWLAARPSLGCPAPWLAAACLATAPFFWEMGRIVVTDMLVTLLVLVSLSSAWQILDSGPSTGRWLAFWASLGLSFLNKGPVGPLIVAMVLVPYMWRTGARWRVFRPGPGLALAGLIGLPWYLLLALENSGLLAYLLKFQTADRVFTTVHKRGGPVWFYLPVLLAGFLPWTTWLLGSIGPAWRNARVKVAGQSHPDLFLLLWVGPPVLFFSLIGSKLPPYVLPVFPGMAILTVRHLPLKLGWRLLSPAIVMAVASILALAQARWGLVARAVPYARELKWAAVWLLVSVAATLMATRRRREMAVVASLLAGMLGLLFLSMAAFTKLSHLSARDLAQAIRREADGPFEVAMFQRYLFGLPYYLGQNVVHVQHDRETQFEKDQDYRALLYPDLAGYLPVFRRGDKDRFLIVSVVEAPQLSGLLSEPVVYSNGSYLVYRHAASRGRR